MCCSAEGLLRDFQYEAPPATVNATFVIGYDPALTVHTSCLSFNPHQPAWAGASVRSFNGGLQDYSWVTVPVPMAPFTTAISFVFSQVNNTLSCSKTPLKTL